MRKKKVICLWNQNNNNELAISWKCDCREKVLQNLLNFLSLRNPKTGKVISFGSETIKSVENFISDFDGKVRLHFVDSAGKKWFLGRSGVIWSVKGCLLKARRDYLSRFILSILRRRDMKKFLIALLLALVVLSVVVESHKRGFKRGGNKRRRGPFRGWIKSMCKEGETAKRIFLFLNETLLSSFVFPCLKYLSFSLICYASLTGHETPLAVFFFNWKSPNFISPLRKARPSW